MQVIYQPETPRDEARHAIPQQDCKRKHQPCCHVKIFDPPYALVISINNR
jgi:hypothetical protein